MERKIISFRLLVFVTSLIILCTSCGNLPMSIKAELKNYINPNSPNNKHHYYELLISVSVENHNQYSSINIELPDLTKTSLKECIISSSQTSTDATSQDFVALTSTIQIDPTGFNKDTMISIFKNSDIEITFTKQNGTTYKQIYPLGNYLKIKL